MMIRYLQILLKRNSNGGRSYGSGNSCLHRSSLGMIQTNMPPTRKIARCIIQKTLPIGIEKQLNAETACIYNEFFTELKGLGTSWTLTVRESREVELIDLPFRSLHLLTRLAPV